MEQIRLNQEEKDAALEWVSDDSWVKNAGYEFDVEYLAYVGDIMDSPVFQSMDRFIQHGDTTCKDHCIKVSYLSYCICRKFGWDCRQAARAALLHDLFLYDWHTHAKETGEYFHGFTHPRVAMKNAEKYFSVTEMEKNMILRHMWPLTPIPPKSREGFAIIYADKFCGLAEIAGRMKKWVVCRLYPKYL